MPNPNHVPWLAEEEEALREAYSSWPIDRSKLHMQTAQRSASAVASRASELGLTNRRLAPIDWSHIPDTTWAYMAGSIDADGTIAVMQGGNKVGVRLVNTNQALIDWARETFPGSTCQTITAEQQNAYASRAEWRWAKSTIHHLKWHRRDVVVALLEGMMPYLIVKRERAQQALVTLLGYTGSN
jgi:hypothetical protein